MKFALALLTTVVAQDTYTISETSVATTYNTGDLIDDPRMENGQEVVAEYNVVTTTVTTEHVDIPGPRPPAPPSGPRGCTDCVYSDMLLVVDQIMIHEWAIGVKADYDLLMRDWERSLDHYSFEIKALNEDYWVMFRPLIEARKAIHKRRQDEVIMYVMNNTYFHGAHIHHVVPEVEAFLKNEFNPVHHNIVSMFGLKALTLQELDNVPESYQVTSAEEWATLQDHPFTFDFNEQEVVAWFQENQRKYDEVAAKYQQDFNTFCSDVNVAVQNY